MESKYKIGQKVRVKSLDWYHNNKDGYGSVPIGDKKPKFTYNMLKYCGQVLTVDDHTEYEGEYYMIEDDGKYVWADEMFEGVVDDHQYHTDMSGRYHPDSEPDNIDKYIMRFDGNECKIALPEGYQFVDREGNIIDTSVIMVTKKEVEYPKDYDGCCNVLNDDDKMSLWMMNELRKLVNIRNAYWKIYGEANGLGGSWKPDWDDGCYVIFTKGDGTIERDLQFGINAILAFPTKELCDMFYERFISEIEQCKELL
jgi:hypothetical protein